MAARVAAFTLFLVVSWIACDVTYADSSVLDQKIRFDIAPQPLESALIELSRQAGVPIAINAGRLDAIDAPAVRGMLTVRSALTDLLRVSGFSFAMAGETIAVVPADSDARIAPERLRSGRTGRPSDSPPEAVETSAREKVLEVVVTAEKRSERLQDVPVPVTVLTADTLLSSNQLSLRDYYVRVPGLNLTESGAYGGSIISIRGITSGVFNDGTTSIVVDDVPYGSSVATGPGEVVPEIDPTDLARIEVLRGPQGTLYGASSLGGLVKYVTVDPVLDELGGQIRAGTYAVRNGDGLGTSVSGALNAPVGETAAVRINAFTRRDPGYIDDPVHRLAGVNWGTVDGGRVSALWRPSPQLSLKLGVLLQDAHSHGNSLVTRLPGSTTLPDLQQNTVPGSGGYHTQLQVYSANLSASLGRVDVVAISAWIANESVFKFDLTPLFGSEADALFGVNGTPSINAGRGEKFTQELRVATPIGERFDWLFGLFFETERNTRRQTTFAADFATGARVGLYNFFDFPSTFEERAMFSDVTVHFSDRFDVQLGGRFNRNDQSLPRQTAGGAALGGTETSVPGLSTHDSSVTYLLTPRFRPSAHLMMYARLASGYRPGGPNANYQLGVPPSYDPDRTQNYELGAKGDLFEGVFSFDASIYYIDWKNIEIGLIALPVNINYKGNAGAARSQGVDASFTVNPHGRLRFSAWGAWNDATLTRSFPTNVPFRAKPGDRLPFSSRFSGSVSLDNEWPLSGGISAVVGVTVSYVGNRKGPFTASGEQAGLPAYVTTDVRAGLSYESWDLDFHATNVADRRGLLNGASGATIPDTYIYERPRTVGLTLSKTLQKR